MADGEESDEHARVCGRSDFVDEQAEIRIGNQLATAFLDCYENIKKINFKLVWKSVLETYNILTSSFVTRLKDYE